MTSALKSEYNNYWRKYKQSRISEKLYPRDLILREMIVNLKGGLFILDVGCGSGVTSELFVEQGHSVVGIDLSSEALKIAWKKGMPLLVCADAEHLLFRDSYFDVVFAGDILEHLFNPEICLCEINRVLRPAGSLSLSVPNAGFYAGRVYTLLYGHPFNLEASGNPPWKWQHIRFYNVNILRSLLATCGFIINKVKGDRFINYSPARGRMIVWSIIIRIMGFIQHLFGDRLPDASAVLIVEAKNTCSA